MAVASPPHDVSFARSAVSSGKQRVLSPPTYNVQSSASEGGKHWSDSLHEVVLSLCPQEGLNSRGEAVVALLPFDVDGGAALGKFLVIRQLNPAKLTYLRGEQRPLEKGDVLLEVGDRKVAGATQTDCRLILKEFCRLGGPLRVKAVKKGDTVSFILYDLSIDT